MCWSGDKMAQFKYRMKDLATIIDRTPARIYDYFKEDTDFYYAESHRRKNSKKGYYYDEEVLERLKNRVSVENDVPAGQNGEEERINPNITARYEEEIERLKKELEDLREQYEELKSNYDKVEAERQEFIKQNGMALLALSQIKMLQKPPIGERIKNFFKKGQAG